MKQILLIALASVAVVGCKQRATDVVVPASAEEIQIGTTQGALSKAFLATPSQFNKSSKIGVFSLEATNPAGFKAEAFKNAKQANLPYGFSGQSAAGDFTKPSLPWTALSTGILTWQNDGGLPTPNDVPVHLVAYHPYNKNLVLDDATKEVMDFAIAADQTELAALNNADLMWAASTGRSNFLDDKTYTTLEPAYTTITGLGVKKSADLGKAINLNFHHMLTKLNFKLGFFKTGAIGTTEVFSDVVIKKIEVTGSKITNAGKLNLLTGVYTATANTAPNFGSSFWAGEVKVEDSKLAVAAPALDFIDVCDLIAAPATFDATSTDNLLKFTVTYKYKKDAMAAAEDKEKVYTFALNTNAAATPTATDFDFKRNAENKFKVSLNLSSSEIYITSTIADWDSVDHNISGN